MTFAKELENKIRAAYPCLYVVAREDWRAVKEVQRVAEQLGIKAHVWTVTGGWDGNGQATDPLEALRAPRAKSDREVWAFVNFHFFLDDPQMVQALKDASQENKAAGRVFVFISNIWKAPAELQDDLTRLEFGLPDRELLLERLAYVLESADGKVDLAAIDRDLVVDAALGLTTFEAENAMTLSLVERGTIVPAVVSREKALTVSKDGLLTYSEPERLGLAAVGGLDNLKGWLRERKGVLTREALDFGISPAKGLLLVGVPGTGKTLTAKAIAAEWELPLLRFDVGKVFQGLVGSSEANIRRVIEGAETVAPCVLFIDELEKAFAGAGSSGSTDSGVTARVFGAFLSWLQDKTKLVFVVCSANKVSLLPPELLRAGRFDEVFALDLPSPQEREEIFGIHLRKKKRELAEFGPAVEASDNFSGAEIESVVNKALIRAFGRRKLDSQADVTAADLVAACRETVPLAVTRKEDIEEIRAWGRSRAVPASTKPEVAVGSERRRAIIT